MKTLNRGLLTMLASSLLVLSAGQGLAATVKVAQGQLTGVTLKTAEVYLGVPYAEPPVGERRWKPPLAAAGWAGDRKADKHGASCVQPLNPPEGRDPWTPEYLIPPDVPVSEDCLYLDVWTPKAAAGKRLPVFVWIHGGALNEGSASVPVYDGANLAANGEIVVVAINYRLGPFGFLVHPDLARESGTSGNYGHMDQVAALEWVKANITAFGGDPDNVTVAGQSAGAGSVMSLTGAPSAKGLFARAIAESGPGVYPRALPLAVSETNGVNFMKSAGANSIEELRRMPAANVLSAAVAYVRKNTAPWRAVIDGRFLPMEPLLAQVTTTTFNDTPVLAGYNLDEGSGFDTAYGSWTQAQIDRQLADFGAVSDQARAIYLPGPNASLVEAGKALARDRGMATTWQWASRRTVRSRHPVYVYNFLHAKPGPKSARYGAFHTGEVPYVFQNLIGAGRTFGPADQQMVRTVSGYWLNFIKTGNPNGPGLPYWPAFNLKDLPVMKLDLAPAPAPILPLEKRDLFEARYQLGGTMPGW